MNSTFRAILTPLAIASVFASLTFSSAHAAFLEGNEMIVRLEHATNPGDTVVGAESGPFTVGAGVEVQNLTLDPVFGTSVIVDIDVSDAAILITAVEDQPFAHSEVLFFGDFNMTIPFIKSVKVNPATTWAGFTASRASASGDQISVNLSQLPGLAGQQILLDVIPEPAAGTLILGAGLALVAARRRRRLV